MTPSNDLLTVPEVADKLRTNAGTLRYWRHIGKGPKSFKVGRRVVYRQSEIDAYIAEAEAAEADR